jgi:hypothetical protein
VIGKNIVQAQAIFRTTSRKSYFIEQLFELKDGQLLESNGIHVREGDSKRKKKLELLSLPFKEIDILWNHPKKKFKKITNASLSARLVNVIDMPVKISNERLASFTYQPKPRLRLLPSPSAGTPPPHTTPAAQLPEEKFPQVNVGVERFRVL